mgnify:CR=1 FL=1
MEDKLFSLMNPSTIQSRQDVNPFAKLSDVVKDLIEEAIIKLYIRPGEKINVVAIADALKLSRTPVREALNTLVREGLVVVRPNVNGYYAFDINDQYMSDFFTARATVEVAATKLCAERFERVDLSHLKDCCQIFRECYYTKNVDAFVKADRDFHNSLVQYTGNQFLIKMYAGLARPMEHYSSISRFYLEQYGYTAFDNFEQMISEHIAIYNVVSLGIVDSAGNTAQRHLDTCFSSFLHYYFSKGLR